MDRLFESMQESEILGFRGQSRDAWLKFQGPRDGAVCKDEGQPIDERDIDGQAPQSESEYG